jgi:hypothetical protein
MKTPTPASLKRVNAENLAGLGAERLAALLVDVANSRPELKRRLRMELAAEQGAEHLAVEVDKRLASLETSRSKVSWRQRPTFVRDLDVLRGLIAGRLAALDPAAALARMWSFMEIARRVGARVRDRDGELGLVFARAAADLAAMSAAADAGAFSATLLAALEGDPLNWAQWLAPLLEQAPPQVARDALALMRAQAGGSPGWAGLLRQMADAAGDVDVFQSTYAPEALRSPATAAQIGRRLLQAGRVEAAGRLLEAARPAPAPGRGILAKARPAEIDFDWETVWIDFLEQSGEGPAAQEQRWAAFERTLSTQRAKAFTQRLTDFEDVEAEGRAFRYAADHADADRGLQFLMDWPALPEAARMIQLRADDLKVSPEQADVWAAKLRTRQPQAAVTVLRKAAAAAFRRREFATCDRLTQEADEISAD